MQCLYKRLLKISGVIIATNLIFSLNMAIISKYLIEFCFTLDNNIIFIYYSISITNKVLHKISQIFESRLMNYIYFKTSLPKLYGDI